MCIISSLFSSLSFYFFFFFFFFSSRRRHTRSYGDWSSDVCSSDLNRLRRLFRETRFEFALVSHSFIHARLKGSRYRVPRRGGGAAACPSSRRRVRFPRRSVARAFQASEFQ